MSTKAAVVRDRDLNLNVRVTEEERAKLHAIAEDRDLSVSTLIRHWVRDAYATRFGNAPVPAAEPIKPAARKGGAR